MFTSNFCTCGLIMNPSMIHINGEIHRKLRFSIYKQFHQLPYMTLCISRSDVGYTQIISITQQKVEQHR